MSDAADRILAGWPDASDAIACAKRVRELEADKQRLQQACALWEQEYIELCDLLERYRPRWEDAPEWATEWSSYWEGNRFYHSREHHHRSGKNPER